ncbi:MULTISPECIES: ABC transporter permease [Flavobacterium]|uniref:ABC transporter permease n=1 Tax=Flavobacterium sedimenticola TaxID=3043286 RepID=A0ABT6XR74_9FLAO|nr:ABC transporter permease [Flavobacterium sedimenticola]MDI9257591.1 ABC transporter permease [Flavobacterium sedimenticola]
MKRLLAIELQKIWKNRASKVLTIGYFVILSFIALIASIKFDFGNFKIHFAEMGIFNFPFIWHFNTWMASLLKFFLAVVIVSMMANEYSYGTLKQNLIDGMSKKEFLLSKFLTVLAFALGSTFFVFVMSLLLGYNFSSYTEIGIVFSDMEYLLAYFVKLLGFFSFCLFLGVLIKRSAFAIGFLFIWFLIEKISYGFMKFEIFDKNPMVDKIYAFMPLESMSNLIIEPFTRLSVIQNIQTAVGENNTKDYDIHVSSILIVLVWTAIFLFSSYTIIKKRDL